MASEPNFRKLKQRSRGSAKRDCTRQDCSGQVSAANGKLGSLISASPGVIYIAKPSGSYGTTFVSKNVRQVTGFNPRDFIKDPDFWFDHVHPEDKALVASEVLKIFDRNHLTYDYRFQCKTGQYIWIRDAMNLVRSRAGKPMEIVGYWIEVTDEKTAELELKKTCSALDLQVKERTTEIIKRNEQLIAEVEARTSATEQAKMRQDYCCALLASIEEDILVIDRDYRVTDMNRPVLRTSGLTREEVIGRCCYEVLHGLPEPCDRMGEKCKLREVLDTGSSFIYRHRHRRNNGENVLVSLLLSPLRESTGNVTGVIAAMRDLSEVIEREKKQQKVEADYRELFENSMDAIAITSSDGRFLRVNQATLKLLGYTQEEITNVRVADTYADPQERIRVQKEIERKGYVKNYAMRLVRKDGTTIYGTMTARARYADDGRTLLGYEGILRDITESRKVEARLKRDERDLRIKSKRLEEANAALRIVLKKVNKDSRVAEEQVVTHVKDLLIPLIRKLKKSGLDQRQKAHIEVLESNLNKVLEPFAYNQASEQERLTPTELQVAHLIREGKSSKDVADLLTMSVRTVGCHRENIREKLGIKNKQENLRSHLIASNNADPISAFHR